MGMPLLLGYYTIHDMDKGRIGFAPHIESSKTKLKKAAQPSTLLNGEKVLRKIDNL